MTIESGVCAAHMLLLFHAVQLRVIHIFLSLQLSFLKSMVCVITSPGPCFCFSLTVEIQNTKFIVTIGSVDRSWS